MKLLSSVFKIGIGSNLAVLFTMMLLPAFIVTDQLDVLEKVIFYIAEK